MEITYTSENDKEYARDIGNAESLPDLRKAILEYVGVAGDALQIAMSMSEENFLEFKKGSKKERSGKFAGEAWHSRYGAVLMPEILFKVSCFANEYKVPWGLAYLRIMEINPDVLVRRT